ncbi:MAG TPA: hypothetical protein PKD55_25760, partial [Bellilinea sp.]|nr:hypothetical protein [Bellilinea sp.]
MSINKADAMFQKIGLTLCLVKLKSYHGIESIPLLSGNQVWMICSNAVINGAPFCQSHSYYRISSVQSVTCEVRLRPEAEQDLTDAAAW